MKAEIAELYNLMNGCMLRGDKLAADICQDALVEIERLQCENTRLREGKTGEPTASRGR